MGEAEEVPCPDTFRILISTDNHLGYMEKDGVRGGDSFVSFEEVLKIGRDQEVDFILLGGDLFHENKPSIRSLHESTELIRKYTLNDKPVQFELHSDPMATFGHSARFPCTNYEDANLNVGTPVFSIHGNHDDPLGPGGLCALDILHASGLVNLFGKTSSVEEIVLTPLLMRKGRTRLAVYGLGAVRDERLHRMILQGKVEYLRPSEDPDAWFSVLVFHQNRSKHGPTNHIPESFLPDFLHLVIWGHEHECRIDPEWNSEKNFYVSQPGSSVATSLCEGEAGDKAVGILEVRYSEEEEEEKPQFRMTKIKLQTVRPFYMEDVILEDVDGLKSDAEKVETFCKEKIDSLVSRSHREQVGRTMPRMEPLIRLRVDYSGGYETFSALRFGQQFVGQVANPKDLILFHRRREKSVRDPGQGGAMPRLTAGVGSSLDSGRVEGMVRQWFEKAGSKMHLVLLTEKELGLGVQTFVDKDAKDAIGKAVEIQVERVQKHLQSRSVDEEKIVEEVERLRQLKETMEGSDDEDLLQTLEQAKGSLSDGENDDLFDDDDDEPAPSRGKGSRGSRGKTVEEEARPARGRGSRGGRARGRARGRGRGGNVTLEAAFSMSGRGAKEEVDLTRDSSPEIGADSGDEYARSSSVRSGTGRKRVRRDSSDDEFSFDFRRKKRK